MRRLGRLIFNRWVLGAIGLIAAAVLIWWVGPLIAIKEFYPLEAEWVRWTLIALIVLIPVVRIVWRHVRARRANAALESGLLQAAKADPAAGEVQQLRQRFEGAMALLRKRSFGGEKPSLWARIRTLGSRQYLYDLPWYVFIGAPGSGKTTALVNSGLRFPLASRIGQEAVHGVGGTRDCDWWFTDEAVFLDTAGRYTTQQSQQEVDAGAWKGFLQLLKKSRSRRPINGVLVTVSMGDLMQESPAERAAHTQAVRARVRELYDELGVRFPIYVLVTKSDLLAGFTEFFAALGKEERAQVWGFSLPYGDHVLDAAALSRELESLERRLNDRLPERLQEEREPTRRILLYGFPQQFVLVRNRLVEFVESTFAPTKFEAMALLRGVYFTSGTQEGSPIDRVMGAFARELQLERKLLPPQHPSGRSYFLTRLLREVVFPEAGLAGLDLRGERRRKWIQMTAIGAAAAGVALATVAWWISHSNNRQYLAEVRAQSEQVRQQVAATPVGTKGDLAVLLATLGSVRSLAEARATPDGTVPWSWRFGLYQGGKLEAASRAAYRRMLQDTFLPSITASLEQYLRQDSRGNQEESYEALKTYVMLYDSKHFARDAAWRWYETHGEQLLPGDDPERQKAFKTHFDALYERGWVDPTLPRNDALVAELRAVIGRDALPKRIYSGLKREPIANIREFTVADKAGRLAFSVFERPSREPLTKGIPALYTKDGYYKHFAKRVDVVAVQLAEEETWVLGTGAGTLASAASSGAVADAVKRLYLEDYRRLWRQFINDVTLVSDRDLSRVIDITRTLSGPDSPLKPLVKAIDRETTLSVPPEGDQGLVSSASGKAQQVVGKMRQAVLGGAGDSMVKSMVDDQFEDIHRLAGGPGNAPAPIDATIQQLNDFYQFLVAAKAALDVRQQPPPGDTANKLRAELARQPEPIRSMLQSLVDKGAGQVSERRRAQEVEDLKQQREKQAEDFRQQREKLAEEQRLAREKQAEEQRLMREKQAEEQRLLREKQVEDQRVAREKQLAEVRQTRERIDAELRAQIADFCVKAIGGRYPFVRTSTQDVTPEDFARLFSPGGLLDGFFQKQLAPLVDTSQQPWRFRDVNMAPSPALAEFQRAQIIRDVFFRGGGSTPAIQLEFKPVQMDASIQQFLLDVDGKVVRYAHGPQVPVRVQFPGPSGRSQVRMSILPPPSSGSSGIKFEGPWALFRMFDSDSVKIEETKQYERFVAAINVEGRHAVFEILASSVRNPFRLPELTQFHCPTAL
jgi:type VI secretion system protein ImpL